MAGSRSSSRCLHCGGLFEADPRNRGRQRFCHADACKKASKRHSQARWLSQPANADYFKGPTTTERVRQWRDRPMVLQCARKQLLEADLIIHQKSHYQVLSLSDQPDPQPPSIHLREAASVGDTLRRALGTGGAL